MNRYNLWKYIATKKGPIPGWEFVEVVHGPNENHVIEKAAIHLKIKKIFLKVYPHIETI